MTFGKRAPGTWRARSVAPRRRTPTLRRVAGILLLVLLGFGGTASATMVRASEQDVLTRLFGSLFGAPQPAPASIVRPEQPAYPRRYASLPDPRRSAETRLVQRTPRIEARREAANRMSAVSRAVSPASFAAGTRTVCVRLCDGYVFPIGRLRARADLPVHAAACAAACPNAPSELFTLAPGRSEMQEAIGLGGQPYRLLARANLFRRERVEGCSCQPAGQAGPLMDLGRDRTLRAGDVIASEDSADLVTNLSRSGPVLADYRTAPSGRHLREAIEGRVGALRRDTAASAFRRSLQVAEARTRRVRVAEAQVARLRMDIGTDIAPAGFAEVMPRAGTGFAPMRVVAPSPFGH